MNIGDLSLYLLMGKAEDRLVGRTSSLGVSIRQEQKVREKHTDFLAIKENWNVQVSLYFRETLCSGRTKNLKWIDNCRETVFSHYVWKQERDENIHRTEREWERARGLGEAGDSPCSDCFFSISPSSLFFLSGYVSNIYSLLKIWEMEICKVRKIKITCNYHSDIQ